MRECIDWYLGVWQQFFVFNGRARRKEFWSFFLCHLIISIALTALSGLFGIGLLSAIYSLAVFIPTVAVSVRRLHDIGYAGWWVLLGLIPFGIFVLLIFLALEGQHSANQYGQNPRAIS